MSKAIRIGDVFIGDGNSVKIQSMNNTPTSDVKSTIDQIYRLKDAGCDITRVAIPDMEAAEALKEITKLSPLPVVADIHFDYRLAISAVINGASKIRINPGNIGDDSNLKKVSDICKERDIPIRVGVNSGSIDRKLIDQYGGICSENMALSAINSIKLLEDNDFTNLVISVKSSSAKLTIETYRILHSKCDYPLHLGVTESGTVRSGIIKSSVGIGTLLAEGIGDTIRVSLTGDPVEEVFASKEILRALELRDEGINFVSCPTCGRTEVPLIELANKIENKIRNLPYNLKVAMMGCVVNGPGEARDADIGLAGGKNEFLLFKKGVPVRKISSDTCLEEFYNEIVSMGEETLV